MAKEHRHELSSFLPRMPLWLKSYSLPYEERISLGRAPRAQSIGCYLDDMVHRMLGLPGYRYQDLYHFTGGRALADVRLIDLPAYD